MRSYRLLATVSLVLPLLLGAPDAAGQLPDDDERYVVITNANIVPIEGTEMNGATIVISGGKITNIGPSIEYPRNARVIDADGMYVMPGLILAETRGGLPSYSRSGVHGDLLAADELHDSTDFDDLLEAGFTTIALHPDGRGMPGRAAVVQTGGATDERVLNEAGHLVVGSSKSELRDALKRAKAEIEKVEKARKEWEEKQKQAEAAQKKGEKQPEKKDEQGGKAAGDDDKKDEKPPASQPTSQPTSQPAKFEPPKIDPDYQPLVDLLQEDEDIRLLLGADQAADILHYREVLDEYEIADVDWRVQNRRQSDLDKVLEDLCAGEEDSPTRVVLRASTHRVPYSAERLPLIALVAGAGCQVTLVPLRDNEYEYRNFLPHVAELVREGWERDDALAAVTLNPARLLGLDEERGSLKKDKVADLIFLDGDPLAPGARVRKVMIGGEIVHNVEDDQ